LPASTPLPAPLPIPGTVQGDLRPGYGSARGLQEDRDDLKAAERLSRRGEPAQALEIVQRFLGQHPEDAPARFLQGVILTDMGRQAEAIDVFTRLTIDHPELVQPYNNLGVLYAKQGALDRARQWLEQAVRANPGNAIALENLADVYMGLATETYTRAFGLNRANPGLRSKLNFARGFAAVQAQAAAQTAPPAAGTRGAQPASGSALGAPPGAPPGGDSPGLPSPELPSP
jgi:tetratricopeptide (TPR) repeat protein